jgi:hypothetical protein
MKTAIFLAFVAMVNSAGIMLPSRTNDQTGYLVAQVVNCCYKNIRGESQCVPMSLVSCRAAQGHQVSDCSMCK